MSEMKDRSSRLVAILDSSMNAYVISLIKEEYDFIDIIYAIDPSSKNEKEYISMFRLLMSNLNISSETIMHYDSKMFWAGDREDMIKGFIVKLRQIIKADDSIGVRYFGNALTNPIAAAAQRLVAINHLYHSPTDFSFLLREKKIKERCKDVAKIIIGRLIGKKVSYVSFNNGAVFSLINFKDSFANRFSHLNYLEFSVDEIEKKLKPLALILEKQNNKILLLLAGSEPEPGDNNPSNINLYLKPHLEAVKKLMRDDTLSEVTVWIREHRSYIPLSIEERLLLSDAFLEIKCRVFFMSDYVPSDFRLLPAECVFRYCSFDYLVGEPSSMHLNLASGPIKLVAACTQFVSFRDEGQLERNNDFIKMNQILGSPCRCI